MSFIDRWNRDLDLLRERDVVPRIWALDVTVWRDDPTEIENRLGWLDVASAMREASERFRRLSEEAAAAGVRDVVLLGMGGSSLGAEVLARVARPTGAPIRLHVLDSTVPGQVRAVRQRLDLDRTRFVVASKSGTTAEVLALRDYFWSQAARASAPREVSFVVVTDPGTPLEAWGREQGLEHVVLNPPDIGGRFSVLSCFGLVPAALAGVDVTELLERAVAAESASGPRVDAAVNPAARLGAFLAAGVASGRDKLTLPASAALSSFGLWAEQLLAESTGKAGTGVLPLADEPPLAPQEYGPDRVFVALRLGSDPELDERVAALERAGHPILVRELATAADLGGEMFVWELATAVAGHLLGVHPFDQPNVQSAKSRTEALLRKVEEGQALPPVVAEHDFGRALADRHSYVAFLGFLPASDEVEEAIAALRRSVSRRTGVATTFGYGPRYLHSTGQLHKGGPPGGLFVQLVDGGEDLPIPGRSYGFATLARAQADGDLEALRDAGRRVVRVEVGGDAVGVVRGLCPGPA
jgi:glucose-6-phosphate isomerase/transaldolase/glucose-6-phosphate isomerase